MNKIAFIGLGKLGLPLACVLASAGNKVLCVDKNEHTLSLLSEGQLPFHEPGLRPLMDQVGENIVGYTDSYKTAVGDTDAAIILVNTQLGEDGYSSDFVETAVSDIAINLKNLDKEYYTIILSSTVLPGTINTKLIPLVEKISNKKYGKDFGFSYVPDFVKLGCVINDFKNPEFFLIGSNHDKDHDITRDIFSGVHENSPPHYRLTLEETEVAKVALNAYVVSKITFANFLGRLCEGMKNVNVHNVTKVIGNDRRISPYFFSSGAPYGGTCFPRDTWAFIKFAKDRDHEAKNLLFAEEVNDIVYNYLLGRTHQHQKIGILGLSFKPNSPVTIGSPSAALVRDLLSADKTVYAYDPLEESYENLGCPINRSESAQECIDSSEVVILMHPDKSYKNLCYTQTEVVDVWGLTHGGDDND